MQRWLRRITPERHALEKLWCLKPFASVVVDRGCWHFKRTSVIRAFSLGLLIAFIPPTPFLPLHLTLCVVLGMLFRLNIPVLVDGAQAVPHLKVDVQDLDVDFYVFSGHKVYGPTGIGVLYGKRALLEAMPPYQGGGDMIRSVTFEKTVYNDLPYKFEAGTPNIGGAIGLGVAIDYITRIGLDNIAAHEHDMPFAICATPKVFSQTEILPAPTSPLASSIVPAIVGSGTMWPPT